jgi:hypothetical protein
MRIDTEDYDWEDFSRYNFETLEEAEQKLDSEHESDTQLTSILKHYWKRRKALKNSQMN